MPALPAPSRPRHVPERSCVACRRKRPQDEFVRVTRTGDGWRVLAGQRVGRGAYVCADAPDCWQEKRLRRAFRGDAPTISTGLRSLKPAPHPPVPHPTVTATVTDQP